MARKNDNSELFSHVSVFGMMVDATTSTGNLATTLSSAVAIGSTNLKITAGTTDNSKADDYGRIGYLGSGSMEIYQIEVPATGVSKILDLVSPVVYAHTALEPIQELTRTDLGDVSDDGVSVEVIADKSRVDGATQIGTLTHHTVHTAYNVSVALEFLSEENLLTSIGAPDGNITGAGTTADPHIVDWTPADIDSINPIHFYAKGTLKSGDNFEIQFWDCRLDPAKTMAFARGKDVPAGFSFSPMDIMFLVPVA